MGAGVFAVSAGEAGNVRDVRERDAAAAAVHRCCASVATLLEFDKAFLHVPQRGENSVVITVVTIIIIVVIIVILDLGQGHTLADGAESSIWVLKLWQGHTLADGAERRSISICGVTVVVLMSCMLVIMLLTSRSVCLASV